MAVIPTPGACPGCGGAFDGLTDGELRAAAVPVEALSPQTEMDEVVVTSIDDVTPVMILPADPLRTRALLLTDAPSAMCIGHDNTVSGASSWVLVFGYSALIPLELKTNGEVWAINAPSTPGELANIRILVERRVP